MNQNWKKQFITVYIGQAFSLLGSAAVQFAIIWWLTVQTESAITLTTATIVGFLPTILIGPFAGVWIDRYNRKTVMIAADGLVALSSVILGIAFLLTNTPPLWFIYFILFLRGLGSTFHSPAMQAAIPTLVPTEMLTKAGGWGNLISSLSTMLGPVLGAAIMGFMPIASIMLIDILGAIFAIGCLLFVNIPDIPKSAEQPNFISDFKQGFLAIKENKPLMSVFFPMMLCNLIYMPLGSLFPLFVLTHFNGTAWHNSICEFAFSGGMLIASLVIGLFGSAKRKFLQVSLALLLLGITSGISGLLPQSAFMIFVVLAFIMGTTGTAINVPMLAYVQETVAPDMLGKVFSLLTTSMTLAMPLGLIVAGPLSEAIGVDAWFMYSGIAMVLTSLICWLNTRKYDVNVPQLEK